MCLIKNMMYSRGKMHVTNEDDVGDAHFSTPHIIFLIHRHPELVSGSILNLSSFFEDILYVFNHFINEGVAVGLALAAGCGVGF